MRGESKPVSPKIAQPARATVPHSRATLRVNRFALIRTAVGTVIAAPRTGDDVITSQFCTSMITPLLARAPDDPRQISHGGRADGSRRAISTVNNDRCYVIVLRAVNREVSCSEATF